MKKNSPVQKIEQKNTVKLDNKTLNMEISLEGINLDPADKKKTPVQIFVDVTKNIMLNWGAAQNNGRGMSEDDRRKYYKISDVLEKAIKEKAVEVELQDDWIGFLRKCKREGIFIPNPLVRRVEEKIEEVKDR